MRRPGHVCTISECTGRSAIRTGKTQVVNDLIEEWSVFADQTWDNPLLGLGGS